MLASLIDTYLIPSYVGYKTVSQTIKEKEKVTFLYACIIYMGWHEFFIINEERFG